MEWIVDVLKLVGNPALLETLATMLIIAILLVWLLRVLVPVLFEVRTKNQKALEETYNAHINELKEMMATQSAEQERQRRDLYIIKTRLTILTNLIEKYNCSNAPQCENRIDISARLKEAAQRQACDTCTKESCVGCQEYDGSGRS